MSVWQFLKESCRDRRCNCVVLKINSWLKQIFNNLIYNFRDLSFLQVTEEYKILQFASLNLLNYFVSNVPELFGGTTFDIRLGEENDSHKCEFFSSVQSLSHV